MWNYSKRGSKEAVIADFQAFTVAVDPKNPFAAQDAAQIESAKSLVAQEISSVKTNGVSITVRGGTGGANRQVTIQTAPLELTI